MSKIFLIGDTHIALGYPNTVNKWTKIHEEYFEKFLFPLLESEVSDGDVIVHLGDLFDNRNVIPINLLNYTMSIVERISKIAPLHILVGNHDSWHKSSSEINTINTFKYIPNVFIYEKTRKIEILGKSVVMMPYIDNKLEQIDLIKEYSGSDYLFCHSDLNGAKMHLTSVANKNTDKIDVDEFSGYKKVMSGHIHIVQNSKNFTFVGSIFQMDRNDTDNQKGIFVLNTSDDSTEFIPNKISPIFKKVYVRTIEDIDRLDNISTRDYIDLYISNSLLIGNRKLRRKLESILDSGNFASVDYIDDISKDSPDKEVEVGLTENLESELDISVGLDYTELIKRYISEQKYDSDKIKNGVMSEFNEIIKIYGDNYVKS